MESNQEGRRMKDDLICRLMEERAYLQQSITVLRKDKEYLKSRIKELEGKNDD